MAIRANPDWKQPIATERQYKASLVGMMDDYIREVKASLPEVVNEANLRLDGVRQDDILSDIATLWEHFKAVAGGLVADKVQTLPNIFSRVSKFNDKQWRRVVKVGTGFNIPASRDHDSASGIGINAYRSEPWLDKMQSAWVSNNTDLITSLPGQMDDRIKQLVKNAVVNGTSAQTLSDQLQKEYGIARNRAELIAIDQIQKANASLAEQRQRDAGVSSYTWSGMMDARERQLHKDREGKDYQWDHPPSGGHPGQPVRCRCHASPSWKGSVFDID